MKNSSNSLRYKTSKTVGKETIFVSIRLDDECKNGHQDFAITGDIYQAGKPKIDKYHISGGCIHEDIEKHFPEFIPFIKLHLCDYEGIPGFAVENGFYHLREGFNNTKPEDSKFKSEFCDYYRITFQQFDELNTAKNTLQYALLLDKLGILKQWKVEANKAIKQLEELTGLSFAIDSVKTQYHAPTPEQLAEEAKRQTEGYYTPQAEAEREKAKMQKEVEKLEAERTKEIEKINQEIDTKLEVLRIGGTKALKNCIFYSHTSQLAFNWRGYDQLSGETVDAIIEKLNLPQGVTVRNEKEKAI